MALTTIPSELSSVSGISDSSSSTAITIDSSQNVTFAGNITTGSNTISGVLSSVTGSIGSAATATTQAASDNSTKLATTAYVTTALANLVDSAPGTLNTLNELAAALGDDANFSTTVTNSIATKLPLAGGTLTGALVGTNASFSTASTTDYVLRLTDNGVADYDVIFPDTSTYQLTTNTSSDKTFKLLNSGSGTFNLSVEGDVSLTGSGNTAVLINTGNNSGDNSQIKFGDSADDDVGQINYDHQNNKFQFRTNGGANSFELESNGNPVFKGTNHTNLQVKSGDDSVVAFLQTVQGTDARFGTSTNHPVNFAQNGSFRLTLDTNGNTAISGLLGVNKAVNTAVALSVGSDATATNSYGLEVTNATQNTRFIVDGVGSSFFYKSDNALGMKFDASTGHVGIGAAPNTTGFGGTFKYLGVNGGTGVGTFNGQTSSTTANQEAASFFGSTTGTSGYNLLGGMQVINDASSAANAEGAVRFFTATGGSIYERMRIENNGNFELLNSSGVTVKLRRNDTDIVNSEVIGQHYYQGDDPSATKTSHLDRVSATGTWTSNYYPSKRAFWFDQGGNLLETFAFYRTQDYGHAVQQLTAGTSASASLRLANDSVNWQVDCRTDDHFAIYNATNARTNLFASRSGTQLGFGTTSPRSDIQCTSTTASGVLWGFAGGISSTSNTFYTINGSNVGVYINSGQQAWNAHSDERIKENITDVGTVLSSLMNMRCVKYNLISNPSETKIGFIAQDWENNFPEVVDEESDMVLESDGSIGMASSSESTTPVKGLSYTETIPLLLKAIQEQQALIEALQTKVAALEGE